MRGKFQTIKGSILPVVSLYCIRVSTDREFTCDQVLLQHFFIISMISTEKRIIVLVGPSTFPPVTINDWD